MRLEKAEGIVEEDLLRVKVRRRVLKLLPRPVELIMGVFSYDSRDSGCAVLCCAACGLVSEHLREAGNGKGWNHISRRWTKKKKGSISIQSAALGSCDARSRCQEEINTGGGRLGFEGAKALLQVRQLEKETRPDLKWMGDS